MPDIKGLYAYAERAEALGFESLWAWDHVLLGVEPSFPIIDSITTLGAVAARTQHDQARHRRARAAAAQPGGRRQGPRQPRRHLGRPAVLGVAAGWYAREFDAVGRALQAARPASSSATSTSCMRLWTEERVTLKVDEFNLREAVMVPRTAQRPRPPVLIGGYVDAVLKRAGTVGDGWLTYFYTPESFTKGWEKVQAFAREAGRDPVEAHRHQPARDLRGPEPRGDRRRTCATGSPPSGTPRPGASPPSSTPSTARPTECIEQLRAHVKTGVNRIILIPYRYEPEQVERIAKEVLPKL